MSGGERPACGPQPDPAGERSRGVDRWLELYGEAGEAARHEREWLESGAEDGDELSSLARLLADARAELRASHARRDAVLSELVERSLAQTTRRRAAGSARDGVGAGRLGDLRLLTRFLIDGWRRSGAVRLTAASLALHLVALPVVAYLALRTPEPDEPRIVFELPGDVPTPFAEQGHEPPVEELGDTLDPLPELRPEVEDRLRGDRFRLSRRAVPPRPPHPRQTGAAVGELGAWLDARWRVLFAGDAEARGPQASEPGSLVELALACELELDRLLIGGAADGRDDPLVREAAARLERWLARLTAREPSKAAGDGLAELALARARAYGVADEPPVGQARRPAPEPLGDLWLRLLERALDEADSVGVAALRDWVRAALR